MAIKRVEGWEQRLAAFLLSRATEPFAWSANDCCTFAADGIATLTGVDIAEDFRGQYKSERYALQVIRKVTGSPGVSSALDYCAAKYALTPVRPMLARRGDLLLVKDSRMIAGLVSMCGQCVCVGKTGLHLLPISCAAKAWTY